MLPQITKFTNLDFCVLHVYDYLSHNFFGNIDYQTVNRDALNELKMLKEETSEDVKLNHADS